MSLGLVGPVGVVYPFLIEDGLWLRRSGDVNVLKSLTVTLNVLTLFGLGDCSLQGVDTERHASPADQEQSFKAGTACDR